VEREGVLTGHISAALRRMLGMRTLTDAGVGSGMAAQVIGTAASSRSLFCVVGPHAVDLALLWYSPDGATLCSCWGHSENVALLSLAGEDSTCWHADAFKAAVEGLHEHKAEICEYLSVREGTKAHAIDVVTHRGAAAAAYDGVVYSPVAATLRRDIKCISVGCRSNQRHCHHATLVRGLDRLARGTDSRHGSSGMDSDDDVDPPDRADGENEHDAPDEDLLVAVARERQKRNLVSCMEEDRQCKQWARTAEWAPESVSVPARPPPSLSADVEAPTPQPKPPSMLQTFIELGVTFDPAVVLCEKHCSKCGAPKNDDKDLIEEPAVLYCDGNSEKPLHVRCSDRLRPCRAGFHCFFTFRSSLSLPFLMHELTRIAAVLPVCHFFAFTHCTQVTIGQWTCSCGHVLEYDGGEDGLFSLRQADEAGRIMVFSRSFCDALVSFVFYSRSSYAAATCFLSSLRSSMGLRRQQITLLGRCYVATLQPTPELFVCPECGDNPDYIVIDGQALGFRVQDGLNVSRPALHLPGMNLNVNAYAIIQKASIRAGIRKVVRTGDRLTKCDASALAKLHEALSAVRPRSSTELAIGNWHLMRHAATLFFRFFKWTAEDDLDGIVPGAALGGSSGRLQVPSAVSGLAATAASATASQASSGGAVPDATTSQKDTAVGGLGDGPVVQPSTVTWDRRVGTCSPRFDTFEEKSTEWATVRPFVLALLGDPVVNLFVGHPRPPLRKLSDELDKPGGGTWRKMVKAANAVGFVANFFARVGSLLDKEPCLRKAVSALMRFAIDVDEIVDKDFKAAAHKAAEAGQTETRDFCDKWLGGTTPEEFAKYAAEHPAFKGKDIDSPYRTYEYFGFLKRVRPAIYTPRAKPVSKTAQEQPAGKKRKGAQAAQEDAGDRCAKSFPKHSQLTAGVFNIVCPHVVTMGFRVMFEAESVADALSVILERFPRLPKVVFYDVACKIDRNGMQRVRTILSRHGVRFCLDRAHAKGHTCSCIYFPDESLAVTNGVSTQAAEVQHSVSVKFRGHLAYMTPASFMAHRIAQLSFMNLTASYKLHREAKSENEGVRLNSYYFNERGARCLRSTCVCPTSAMRSSRSDGMVRSSDVEGDARVDLAANATGVDSA